MRSMYAASLLLALALLLHLTTPPARALGPTIPSDFYEYTMSGSMGPEADGYYFLAMLTGGGQNNLTRSYLMILDKQGNPVWYRRPPMLDTFYSNFYPDRNLNRYFYTFDSPNSPEWSVILDGGYEPIDTLHVVNPFNDEYKLDAHEYFYDDEGYFWSLWRDGIRTDMSVIIDGGNPDAFVNHHVVQRWDPDENLVWEWHSVDHLDQLGYYDVDDTTWLLNDAFDLFHINAFDVTHDGDVLISPRRMSVLSLIDYDTGNIEWSIGSGPANDFTFLGDAGEYDLDFNRQHDGRMWEDGTLTVYDNGNLYDPQQSFGREYVLDTDNMTAELVFYHTDVQDDDPLFGTRTGSMRKLPNGARLIGWGGGTPFHQGTLLSAEEELLWQVSFPHDTLGSGTIPGNYRVYWRESFSPATRPYVSQVVNFQDESIELVCNWFGHEDEVDGFEVYFGTEWDPPYVGITSTGVFLVDEDLEPNTGYRARIRAINNDGDPISPWSETLEMFPQYLGVDESRLVSSTAAVVTRFELTPAYPNPFNAATRIALALDRPGDVSLTVHDVLGRTVLPLHAGPLPAGRHAFQVDADRLASGVFFIRATDQFGHAETRRITLVK